MGDRVQYRANFDWTKSQLLGKNTRRLEDQVRLQKNKNAPVVYEKHKSRLSKLKGSKLERSKIITLKTVWSNKLQQTAR